MKTNKIIVGLGNIEKSFAHMYDGLECLLVIKGALDVEMNKKVYHLKSDDLIVINETQFRSVFGDKSNIVFSLKISREFIETECGEIAGNFYDCKSNGYSLKNDERYMDLKKILINMLLAYVKKEEGYTLEFQGYVYNFLYYINKYFKAGEKAIGLLKENAQQDESITQILSYINENYSKPLSLELMAGQTYMSPQYFSKYFKRKTGIGFLEYVTKVRLEHAIEELTHTNESIIKLAMRNGFANAKSFNKFFHKAYGQTPSDYRKLNKSHHDYIEERGHEFDLSVETTLLELIKYLNLYDIELEDDEGFVKNIKIDLTDKEPWTDNLVKPSKFVNIGHIRDALRIETMAQLEDIQKKLSFNYVYMSAFTEKNAFNFSDDIVFSYYEYFQAIAKFHELQLIPCFQIDISEVDNRSDLIKKIQNFLQYFNKKFPRAFMTQWKFELYCPIGEDVKEFVSFYDSLERTVKKEIDSEHIGILAYKENDIEEKLFFKEVMQSLKQMNTKPAFISCYAQGNKVIGLQAVTKARNRYYNVILESIQETLDELEIKVESIYVTKWNTLSMEEGAQTGTFYRAALVVDAMISVWEKVSGMGFYLNTYTPAVANGYVDTGILALFLYYRVKRPVYFVLEALVKIQGAILYKDNNIIISNGNDGEYIIMVYNPCYIEPIYTISREQQAQISDNIKIVLKGLEKGSYRIRKVVFNADSSGLFNQWEKAGYPDFVEPSVISYLESTIAPKFELKEMTVDEELILKPALSFNSITMYIMKRYS